MPPARKTDESAQTKASATGDWRVQRSSWLTTMQDARPPDPDHSVKAGGHGRSPVKGLCFVGHAKLMDATHLENAARVRHVEVVIPARNEEQRIAACLASVSRAVRRLHLSRPEVTSGITVVLDRCTDSTGVRVREWGARAVVADVGCVGAARHIGAEDAIARCRRKNIRDRSIWLASTDADSAVPETWLSVQAGFGDSGLDAVIGTVTPDTLAPNVLRRWHERHRLTEGHGHIHGANLGMRASAYLAAGGFAALAVHEDRDLVSRLKTLTNQWIATHRTNVVTSARADSRVDGGFATYLSRLANGDPSRV